MPGGLGGRRSSACSFSAPACRHRSHSWSRLAINISSCRSFSRFAAASRAYASSRSRRSRSRSSRSCMTLLSRLCSCSFSDLNKAMARAAADWTSSPLFDLTRAPELGSLSPRRCKPASVAAQGTFASGGSTTKSSKEPSLACAGSAERSPQPLPVSANAMPASRNVSRDADEVGAAFLAAAAWSRLAVTRAVCLAPPSPSQPPKPLRQ
mmetsp:Transcript_60242/g.168194  ORF Transcript_60242/g.168194 Transcript_60242/m.168194 type:complete len:209 (-) Transcript_60242:1743-2369(-)